MRNSALMRDLSPAPSTAPTSESWWDAVVRRDPAADGNFVFAVTTTKIYCRPSCPARRPQRRHAEWFADPASAEAAGYRACRRCDPRGNEQARLRQVITDLCARIRDRAGDGTTLSLATLAREVNMSVSSLQRHFKAIVGLTPRQFLEAERLEVFRRQVPTSTTVTAAIYEAGFGSASRVYERSSSHLGMTPSQYRRRGRDLEITWATTNSPLGRLLIAATDRGVCSVQFGDNDAELEQRLASEFPAAKRAKAPEPHSPQLAAWLGLVRNFLAGHPGSGAVGPAPSLELPLDLQASAFSIRVWRFLRTIPYGSTRSYAEVAAAIGAPGAARAVARACASNPTALVIPCHRVLRGSGELAGYRWGVERKRQLLEIEAGAP